jgi:hypothetical protein
VTARIRTTRGLVALAALLAPAAARAHLVNSGLGPFYDGFRTSPSRRTPLPALALALLAGQRGRRGRVTPALPGAWLVGGLPA